MHIRRKQEGLFRFLHQSKLLTNNTTNLIFQRLGDVHFSDISQVFQNLSLLGVWERGFQFQLSR